MLLCLMKFLGRGPSIRAADAALKAQLFPRRRGSEAPFQELGRSPCSSPAEEPVQALEGDGGNSGPYAHTACFPLPPRQLSSKACTGRGRSSETPLPHPQRCL